MRKLYIRITYMNFPVNFIENLGIHETEIQIMFYLSLIFLAKEFITQDFFT